MTPNVTVGKIGRKNRGAEPSGFGANSMNINFVSSPAGISKCPVNARRMYKEILKAFMVGRDRSQLLKRRRINTPPPSPRAGSECLPSHQWIESKSHTGTYCPSTRTSSSSITHAVLDRLRVPSHLFQYVFAIFPNGCRS